MMEWNQHRDDDDEDLNGVAGDVDHPETVEKRTRGEGSDPEMIILDNPSHCHHHQYHQNFHNQYHHSCNHDHNHNDQQYDNFDHHQYGMGSYQVAREKIFNIAMIKMFITTTPLPRSTSS